MKKIITIVTLGLALCAVFPGCSKKDGGGSTDPGAAIELNIKWAVGKKYIQHLEMNQSSKATIGSRPMEQTINMGSDYAIAVPKGLTGGGSELEMEFLGQKMLVVMDGQTKASFDSATDPANDGQNPVAPTLRKMIGLRIEYEADAKGRVQKVLGLDEVIERLGGNTPQGAMIKSRLSEGALIQYVDVGRGLPDHAVRIGDTWPVKTSIPSGPVTLQQDLTYTFTGWEEHAGHKCARLDYAGTMGTTTDDETAKATTARSGKMTGTVWFDPAAGMVIENSRTQTMEVKTPAATNGTLIQTSDQKLTGVADIK